eukprot:CAMPEP_0181311210 /NCGR_PEP_ID=MMETSP1101-20121128/13011_1 /TAXON_ID=46948 /ORGANISM="Rhodomonas abbreviata, Strain Caron Lab Isolate" /LENGTH=213 /DNA_ID=CAMNT_0023417917 /DNA_START=260 /DNA_END=901 /DNA_ORIENTATION=-
MTTTNDEEKENGEKEKTGATDDDVMDLGLEERKAKAVELRKEAFDLEAEAAKARKAALQNEQEAAKLRIRAWKLEGSVSAVTKDINIENKYERQLAELDLMAEDWIDTDEEKWDWYQKQRQIILEMIDGQQFYDQKADEQIQDLKEVLMEVQQLLSIETIDGKGDITSAGWGFVLLSVVIPIAIGYELFNLLSSSSAAFFGALSGSKDPFDTL